MTDQRPPHDPPDPEDDDAVIELTDVVSSPETDREDIIELTDIVQGEAVEEDDVIELTEVVAAPPPPEPAEAASGEEPVIDLTDVVVDETAHAEPVESAPEISDEEALANALLGEVEDSTGGELEFADMDLDIENQKEEALFDSLGMNMEADLLQAETDTGELDFNLSTQELSDAIDLLDAKLAEEPRKAPPAEAEHIHPPASLEPGQLEAALENVIRKMFGEKIDRLLNEAIEKTVSAELARLKDQLLGDTTDKP